MRSEYDVQSIIQENARADELSISLEDGELQWEVGSALLIDTSDPSEAYRARLLLDAHDMTGHLKVTPEEGFAEGLEQGEKVEFGYYNGKSYWVVPVHF